jgi:hypothetical protein
VRNLSGQAGPQHFWAIVQQYGPHVNTVEDLRDAVRQVQEDSAAFRKRFGELRAQHERKPSLLDRFDLHDSV